MLVQERSNPVPTTHNSSPTKKALHFKTHKQFPTKTQQIEDSRGGGDDDSTGISALFSNCNSTKILLLVLAVASAALVLFLFRTGDSAAFLCFESAAKRDAVSAVPYPKASFAAIPWIPDTSRYATFRTERWIVVSVSSSPTDALRALARIKGWQLLAIGNAETPPGFRLKGAIFLSLDDQAKLGFRVVDRLPYNSYIRKTVGYLFAIQHGAKKIYDADDRAEVTNGDLGHYFDLELVGEEARRETILQYVHGELKNNIGNSKNSSSLVVNPYIHFGQRSVWPRGLPLENVGFLEHEEFYTEVYGGKQFIQQGVSNGLPDVDSVFYSTRKSGFEPFDIRFDENAPRIALPQGIMAPVNSFNTLFHSPAFWGLMLPVSVSSMASDVIRGYWAQRILWEIGGFVAFYQPTIHRVDQIQAYPFSEEKDLHVNVGRLVKFLVAWRSNKKTLFEKIVDLSHAMAQQGFWSEQDVEFTVAWLQDLLAVGYLQPRLMTLELDRTKALIGHGDHKEFIPLKLPSMHLGVQEADAVNYEIGNLIQWRKNLGNVVLIMYCEGNANQTALKWRMLYGRLFKSVIILSETNNPDLGVEYGGQVWEVYKFLPKIFERFANAQGFLFVKDDTIVNYWNLIQADKNKLWITDKVSQSWVPVLLNSNNSAWYLGDGGADTVKKIISSLPVHFQLNYKENIGEEKLIVCNSEIFYIPQRFVGDFVDLVGHVGDLTLHQKLAVPMFFLSMDSLSNCDSDALKTMIYKTGDAALDPKTFYSAEVGAVHPWKVFSDPEFMKLIRAMSSGDPLLLELL